MPSERELIQRIHDDVAKLTQAAADAPVLYEHVMREATAEHKKRVGAADAEYQRATSDYQTAYEQQNSAATEAYQQRATAIRVRHTEALAAAIGDYDSRKEGIRHAIETLTSMTGLLAAPWSATEWAEWSPATPQGSSDVPDISALFTRIGALRETGTWDEIAMPALIPFPGDKALLFEVDGDHRATAIQAMQSVLLRTLATFPAGKLRFTFLDPVGQGQNVASLLRLGKDDADLITGKAWSESQHIEQRLLDLTEHIGYVIQKYLLDRYPTIAEYNAKVGEIAEPYRLLVVCDFPTKFNKDAAERLRTIVENGPRCGIFTIILADPTAERPSDFDFANLLSHLERVATVVAVQNGRLVWKEEDFQESTLARCTSVYRTLRANRR